MRIAVIDFGSTSFHVLVVDVDRTGGMRRVARKREMLHLGATVAVLGHLPDDLQSQAVRAGRMLRRAADAAEPDRVVAVATSALRDATNGGHLIDRLSTAVRSPVRLLDGHEEARLVYTGVRTALPLGEGPVLVCDLGGGSLELALGLDEQILWDTSLPLGASRLTAQLFTSDPPRERECTQVAELVRASVTEATTGWRDGPCPPCIATGGTAHLLARLTAARRGMNVAPVNGSSLPAAELHRWADDLTTLDRDRRLDLDGMRARRVDILPAGAVILATLVETLDLGGLLVSEAGLREGIILDEASTPRTKLATLTA
jgi:exopolyphosphatase/guanosine-5'-triphosphate,3'-diphosphate pyrophosphatase